jgi:AbrB family looped-hinge helix DNA binding protein
MVLASAAGNGECGIILSVVLSLTKPPPGITFGKGITGALLAMTTTVTVKGQVTLPKKVRDAVGIKPGDKVEVRATASGGVYIEKPGAADDYKARLYALANKRLIRGTSTDEIMKELRGDPDLDPGFKPPSK